MICNEVGLDLLDDFESHVDDGDWQVQGQLGCQELVIYLYEFGKVNEDFI